jgi:hypothetical protein
LQCITQPTVARRRDIAFVNQQTAPMLLLVGERTEQAAATSKRFWNTFMRMARIEPALLCGIV